MECETTIEADGNDMIYTICMSEMDNLSSDEKELYQTTFDEMKPQFQSSFAPTKTMLPDLEKVIINFCEKDGDIIAEIVLEY